MRKKRGYNRDTPKELLRDYKLFAIACEGSKREPEYFNLFRYMSPKIKVDIIEDYASKNSNLKSAPKWVLERALCYIEKEGLNNDDDLWFVMDIDRWKTEQLREINDLCSQNENWHIVLSNPCFEVWLYFHKKEKISFSVPITCQMLKKEISKIEKGGYHPQKILPYLKDAIKNAKQNDTNKNFFIPNINETKVYELGEALLTKIGDSDFNNFISNTFLKL